MNCNPFEINSSFSLRKCFHSNISYASKDKKNCGEFQTMIVKIEALSVSEAHRKGG